MEPTCSRGLQRTTDGTTGKTLEFPDEFASPLKEPEALAQHLLQQRQMCV
jgi:hypothetical protein